jgi:hypothetical protein
MKSFFTKTNVKTNSLIVKYWKGDYKSLINHIKKIPNNNFSVYLIFRIITKYKSQLNDICFLHYIVNISENIKINVVKNDKPLFKIKKENAKITHAYSLKNDFFTLEIYLKSFSNVSDIFTKFL